MLLEVHIDFCVSCWWVGLHDQVTDKFGKLQVSQSLFILFRKLHLNIFQTKLHYSDSAFDGSSLKKHSSHSITQINIIEGVNEHFKHK